MSQDFDLYLRDILDAIARIRRYVQGMSRSEFEADDKTADAVIRNLEIIGEAAKAVPDTVRLAYPEIEWRKMSRLRDLLIHHYFGIDLTIVSDISFNKLDALEASVRAILDDSDRTAGN